MAILLNSLSAKEGANDLSQLMSEWLHRLDVAKQFRTCVSCVNLLDDKFCKHFNANPPASIIVKGCDSHKHIEDIPF